MNFWIALPIPMLAKERKNPSSKFRTYPSPSVTGGMKLGKIMMKYMIEKKAVTMNGKY